MLTNESPKKLTDAKNRMLDAVIVTWNECLCMLRPVVDVQRLLNVAAAGLLAPLVLTTAAWAQNAAAGAPEADSGQATAATLRTLEDMQAFEAAHPAVPTVIPPNLPTMDFQQYLDLKKVAPVPGQVKPGEGLPSLPAARPILGPLHCGGLNQTMTVVQGFFPPDTHGAVGANHYGQIVNSAIRFYSKALTGSCPTSIVVNLKMSSFFGYVAQALFDPRILYDLTYNRWIVSAEAFEESAAVQHQFIAVSHDSDPTHGFFIYDFNARDWVGNGVFWDYPQIGYDEDAVILTGNKFNPFYIGSTPVFLPKHRMYAGLGFSYCFFNGGSLNVGTLTPPIVLDQGPYTTVASVAPGGGFVRVTKWTNGAHACPTFVASNDIAVTTNVPPLAQQPGFANCTTDPAHCLDTLDGRFQSQGTQNGSPVFGSPVKFWQVRTDGAGVFPIPHTYRVNADAATIEENCSFFLSGTSFDFNPSIVSNAAGTLFVTWSATDPPANKNAQVRLGGKLLGDACGIIGAGVLVNQSTNPLTGNFDPNHGVQRWGDTSAITLDPSNTNIVYGVNEKVLTGPNPTKWQSFFFNGHNP
jgi:hypothetical protein